MTCVWHMIMERKRKFGTLDNKHEDFPVGTEVVVITRGQDFYFFDGNESGVVIGNTGEYLGIKIKFDIPRYFEDGHIQENFNFNPSDLMSLEL